MSVKYNGMHQSQIKLQDFSAYFWNTPRISVVGFFLFFFCLFFSRYLLNVLTQTYLILKKIYLCFILYVNLSNFQDPSLLGRDSCTPVPLPIPEPETLVANVTPVSDSDSSKPRSEFRSWTPQSGFKGARSESHASRPDSEAPRSDSHDHEMDNVSEAASSG